MYKILIASVYLAASVLLSSILAVFTAHYTDAVTALELLPVYLALIGTYSSMILMRA